MTTLWAFLRAGGVPMIAVIFFSGAAFINACRFAWSLNDQLVAHARALILAGTFAICAAVAADLAAVMVNVPNNPKWAHSPDLPVIVMQGIGEALTPAILGCTLLALSWFVLALGLQRSTRA